MLIGHLKFVPLSSEKYEAGLTLTKEAEGLQRVTQANFVMIFWSDNDQPENFANRVFVLTPQRPMALFARDSPIKVLAKGALA